MKEIDISEFKARCGIILESVRKTRKPIRITRFGRPIAEVVPPSLKNRASWLGSMKGRTEILGDITSPATDPEEWEVLRD
jgi:prevent-host-death family protein